MNSKKLTSNFSEWEVFHSQTAEKESINNRPDGEEYESVMLNAIALAKNILQPIRDRWGKIAINSWYRSFQLNRFLKGASTSQHQKGEAVDIRTGEMKHFADMPNIFEWTIRTELPFDQVIYEVRGSRIWIHVSHKANGENRRQALVSEKPGKYVPYVLTEKIVKITRKSRSLS